MLDKLALVDNLARRLEPQATTARSPPAQTPQSIRFILWEACAGRLGDVVACGFNRLAMQ